MRDAIFLSTSCTRPTLALGFAKVNSTSICRKSIADDSTDRNPSSDLYRSSGRGHQNFAVTRKDFIYSGKVTASFVGGHKSILNVVSLERN